MAKEGVCTINISRREFYEGGQTWKSTRIDARPLTTDPAYEYTAKLDIPGKDPLLVTFRGEYLSVSYAGTLPTNEAASLRKHKSKLTIALLQEGKPPLEILEVTGDQLETLHAGVNLDDFKGLQKLFETAKAQHDKAKQAQEQKAQEDIRQRAATIKDSLGVVDPLDLDAIDPKELN